MYLVYTRKVSQPEPGWQGSEGVVYYDLKERSEDISLWRNSLKPGDFVLEVEIVKRWDAVAATLVEAAVG